jgi:fermentation-respiration switch protein FrsA (DUF1100 family)
VKQSGLALVKNIQYSAVLTIPGSNEEAVHVRNAQELQNTMQKTTAKHELVIIEGADHNDYVRFATAAKNHDTHNDCLSKDYS